MYEISLLLNIFQSYPVGFIGVFARLILPALAAGVSDVSGSADRYASTVTVGCRHSICKPKYCWE